MSGLAIIVVTSRAAEQVTQQSLVAPLVLFSLEDVELVVATLSTARLVHPVMLPEALCHRSLHGALLTWLAGSPHFPTALAADHPLAIKLLLMVEPGFLLLTS